MARESWQRNSKIGKAIRVEPRGFSPRVLEELLELDRRYPLGVTYQMWGLTGFGGPDLTLGQLVTSVCHLLHVEPDLSESHLAGLDSTSLRSVRNRDATPLLALHDELKSHGFSYDVRYGKFCIDKTESIAAWHDQTGVSHIIPPPRSRLDEAWHKTTWIHVFETPFQDVVQYLGEYHNASFDLSLLPQTATGESRTTVDTPVTVSIGGSSLKSALATLLQRVNCRASLRDETFVIEAQ